MLPTECTSAALRDHEHGPKSVRGIERREAPGFSADKKVIRGLREKFWIHIERERSARFLKEIPDFHQSWECTYHKRIIRSALPFDLPLTFADTQSKSARGFCMAWHNALADQKVLSVHASSSMLTKLKHAHHFSFPRYDGVGVAVRGDCKADAGPTRLGTNHNEVP